MRLTPKDSRYKGQGDCPIAGRLFHEWRGEADGIEKVSLRKQWLEESVGMEDVCQK